MVAEQGIMIMRTNTPKPGSGSICPYSRRACSPFHGPQAGGLHEEKFNLDHYLKPLCRRRGFIQVYILFAFTVLLGFCSLAVDFGRAQVIKTELRRAADAGARAGVYALSTGATTSSAKTAAVNIVNTNTADGAQLNITTSSVLTGNWSSGTFTNGGSPTNAIKVTISRTNAAGNPVHLYFASILGHSTLDISASSVAIYTTTTTTQFVSAHGNPWLAGQPSGTQGSVADTGYPASDHAWKKDVANPSAIASAASAAGSSGSYTPPTDSTKLYSSDLQNNEPYGSPTPFTLSVNPGSTITLSASGTASNHGYLAGDSGTYTADGNSGTSPYSDDAANPGLAQGTETTSGTENGLSNIIAPLNSMLGVFMDQNGATYGANSTQETSEAHAPATPSGLDFTDQTARDYSSLSPMLNQPFYVGNGQTSTGGTQTVVVPANAYTLFLGTMDGHEWSNNVGGFTVSVTQTSFSVVQ
jgi:Flp pilus assembly protein TadG